MFSLSPVANYDGLFYFWEGACLCIVNRDFKNLQESPAVFPECPMCGSCKVLPPAPKWSVFTCDDCAHDFVPGLSALEEEE